MKARSIDLQSIQFSLEFQVWSNRYCGGNYRIHLQIIIYPTFGSLTLYIYNKNVKERKPFFEKEQDIRMFSTAENSKNFSLILLQYSVFILQKDMHILKQKNLQRH